MAGTSLYSIIQFRPDIARGEGVNVGVVLLCHQEGRVEAKFSSNNELAKKHFGKQSFDDARLSSSKHALAERIKGIAASNEALRDFISREAGNLVFVEPRPVVVEDFDAILTSLFDDLVGERQPQQRKRSPAVPDLDSVFLPLLTAKVALRQNISVSLPFRQREIQIPYAYRNGVDNLLKPIGFKAESEEALGAAEQIGADGLLISKHPDEGIDRKLVVVGGFENSEIIPTVRSILEDFNVKLVPEADLPELVEEIRKTAHR